MLKLSDSLAFIFFSVTLPLVFAQNCDNYGLSNDTQSCACPPGFGGSSCNLQACGGTLFQGQGRPTSPVSSSSQFSNATSCSCENGWGGFGCNVCRTANACQAGYTALNGNSSIQGDSTHNGTIVCSTGPRVWAASEMSCRVINPTLQAIYPLSSTLNILRTLDPSLTLSPNLTSFGSAGNIHAQLIYDGVEQFFCQATGCTQMNSNNSSDWTCGNLKCTCRPDTTFCGAVQLTNLTQVIDDLSDTLQINCLEPTSQGSTCTFQQPLLENLFGPSGLALSDCQFGECVRQSVIDLALSNSTTSGSSGGASSLSGGVIGGIAVIAAFLGVGAACLAFAWRAQRTAKRAGATLELGDKPRGGVGMEWSELGLSVNTERSKARLLSREERGVTKSILSGVSGRVAPGTMLAILGPSGAGKTSLVDILSGQEKRGDVTGRIHFFSTSLTGGEKVEARPRIGYVDQADVLPPTLTVHEALLFAACLRLPENVSHASKLARVDEVMEQLGLSSLAHTRIGNQGHRGLSGGEMRRVSIGLEIVGKPDILILDEPTSGLDSASAYKVASVLRNLAHDSQNPTAIIASIHQPSSHLYQMFDSILLLAHGRVLYIGEGGSKPADTLAAKGFPPCPAAYSVPDHLLDIASDEELHSSSALSQAPQGEGSGGENVEKVVDSADLGRRDGDASLTSLLRGATNTTTLGFGSSASAQRSASFLTQLQVLCSREWKNLLRDKTLFWTHLAVAIVLGVFCGGLYYQTGTTIAGFQSRVGCLFFLGSLLAFSSLSALFNLVEARPLFLRERAGRYYSPSAWLLSRILFDVVPLRILPTIILSTIVYWMAGLSPHADRFFKFLFILVLYALAMTIFNFMLAALFRNGGIAILLSAIWNLFMMTFAGFFVHLGDIPPVLRWLQYLSILKYCLEALSVNEINSGLTIQDTLEGVPVNVPTVVIMKLLFGFGANNYYRDALVLFAFIAGFTIVGLMIVIFKLKERR